MSPLDLTPEQRQRAQVLAEQALMAAEVEIRQMAELLASKPDGQVLGAAEFQVRDRVHTIGARAIEAALDERKKGATKAPVSAARPATAPASSSADRIGPSSA